ncbi:MAG: ThuA domain-containing protein, partial [Verrucomicrobia bacterium]
MKNIALSLVCASVMTCVAQEASKPSPLGWEAAKTKVLIVAGGSSHDFKKWFEDYDSAFLIAAGYSVNCTEDSATATTELKNADVAIISANKGGLDTPEWRTALFDFVATGKGVIMLHPGTWYSYGNWPQLNAKIVGGGAHSHDSLGTFTVNVLLKHH